MSELGPRLLRSVDALFYSYGLLRLSYQEMWPAASRIRADRANIFPALAACWSFVDYTHRIRAIAQGAPRVRNTSPEMRAFLEGTKLAEEYRHYIQHLREEVSKSVSNREPVYGSLAWVDPDDSTVSHSVLLGAVPDIHSHSSCAFDNELGEWVSNVSLSLTLEDGSKTSFEFDRVFRATIAIERYLFDCLLGGLQIQWPPKEPPMMSIRVARIDGGQHSGAPISIEVIDFGAGKLSTPKA